MSWIQKYSLIALYKLSKASLVYPHCYILREITFGSHESGGAFSDVHKGQHGDRDLCLKVIRIHQKSDTDAMLKVRLSSFVFNSVLYVVPDLCQGSNLMGTALSP